MARVGQNRGAEVGNKTGENRKHPRDREQVPCAKGTESRPGGWRAERRGTCGMRLGRGPQHAPGGLC